MKGILTVCVALFTTMYGEMPALAGPPASTANCEPMLSVTMPNTEMITSTFVAAIFTIPAHCRVVASTHGEPGSNVTVEVRLPDDWNGKLVFTTRQGFMGALPPLGNAVVAESLSRHYATVTTDGGHSGASPFDASFGLNNLPAKIDFGYRGVHLAKVVGAGLMDAYYGSVPAHSYYDGCSSSGRYGIQAAEHYPADFDGIIAGAPALDLAGLTVGFNWNMQAAVTAPIPADKLNLIATAATAACDAIDGLVDGLIDDPRNCHFDPGTLACQAGDGPDCLTSGEIATLEKIYNGPSRSAASAEDPGEQIYPGFPPGGEFPDPVGQQGWDFYVASATPAQLILQDQFLRFLAFDDPNFDWRTFNFDVDPDRLEAIHEITDAVQDDLQPFSDAGGKMIIYQGWGDIAQSPYRTIQYYQGLRRHVGRRPVEDSVRLFMAPGMYHCGGGIGPNTFDALTALERWVEAGQPPASMLASYTEGPGTIRTRPLCPFPQHAVYKGTGSIDDAANFECRGAPLGSSATTGR